MPTLLVIDDQQEIRDLLRRTFSEPEFTVHTANSAAEGLAEFAACQPDVVMLDIFLGKDSGLETLQRIHELDPRVPIILMTGAGTTATAIEATALGGYDYILKPFNLAGLRPLVSRACEVGRMMRSPVFSSELKPGDEQTDVLVGRSPQIQEVYKSIGRVARQDVTVLILGESGTGKELVARAIYQHSDRSAAPFLAINCAAIPETLLESELFGHEKGAFTGAERKRIGKFEQCSGGTLFLDEIGDMTPLTQTKILRVLQEQRFERVGGQETIQTNVRLIAATNVNLEHMVESGQFRKDLYYRLNVYAIALPPLRERIDDIPVLVEHFVRQFSRELGKEILHVSPEAVKLLQRYPWPGNIRELQSVLKQALLHATCPILLPDFLPTRITHCDQHADQFSSLAALKSSDFGRYLEALLKEGSDDLYKRWLSLTDGYVIARVLRHTEGNVSSAARLLGLDRGTLRQKIKSLGIASPAPVIMDFRLESDPAELSS
jgi:DNA-binding NtrC family response regulator